MSNSFKDQSRDNWEPTAGNVISTEQLAVGSLQRIADATEAMAQNYVRLQNDRNQYKRWYEEEKKSAERMARRIAALQGVITKMKRRAQQ